MSDNTTEIKRPVLSKENFDKTNERFQYLVKSYKNWCEDGGDKSDDYEEEMKDLLLGNRHNLDGYKLAKELESDLYLDPDARLVDILDMASVAVESLNSVLIKKWVQENNLSLADVVGKKVQSVRNSFKDFNGYFVTITCPEKLQVCLDLNPTKKGGYIINLEDIVFCEEKPE